MRLSPDTYQYQFSHAVNFRGKLMLTSIFSQQYPYIIMRKGNENHKMVTKRKMLWSFNEFSQLMFREMYEDQSGEFVCWYWDFSGLRWSKFCILIGSPSHLASLRFPDHSILSDNSCIVILVFQDFTLSDEVEKELFVLVNV